jgi:hypothetical protein
MTLSKAVQQSRRLRNPLRKKSPTPNVLVSIFTTLPAFVLLIEGHLSSKMSPDKTKQLVDSYPKVFSHVKHLECDDGWFPLIRSLCSVIEYEVGRLPLELQEQIHAVQIKEKFGGLRFYMNHETPKISGAIALAEELSNNTCEVCGGLGGHKNVGGWLATLCDTHYQSKMEERKEQDRQFREEEKARKGKKLNEAKKANKEANQK